MSLSSREMRRIRAASEAAEWIERMEVDGLSPSARAEFVDWLRESPVHVAEMLRARKVRAGLVEFDGWETLTVQAGQDAAAEVVRLHPSTGRAPESPKRTPAAWRPRRGVLLAAAAVVIAAIGTLLFVPGSSTTQIATQGGEKRQVTLKDGSTITLADNTTVRYRLDSQLRSVELERGAALFHVSKDPRRPFVVTAAHTSIRAVGTVFTVVNNAAAVVVTVSEGRVAVNPAAQARVARGSAGAAAGISVGANEQVAIGTNGHATAVRSVAGTVDWAAFGTRLSFENQSVAEIVARFNAVNRLKIRVTDERLAGRRVTGTFDASDPESFVGFLEAAAGTIAIERQPGEIDVGAADERRSADPGH